MREHKRERRQTVSSEGQREAGEKRKREGDIHFVSRGHPLTICRFIFTHILHMHRHLCAPSNCLLGMGCGLLLKLWAET